MDQARRGGAAEPQRRSGCDRPVCEITGRLGLASAEPREAGVCSPPPLLPSPPPLLSPLHTSPLLSSPLLPRLCSPRLSSLLPSSLLSSLPMPSLPAPPRHAPASSRLLGPPARRRQQVACQEVRQKREQVLVVCAEVDKVGAWPSDEPRRTEMSRDCAEVAAQLISISANLGPSRRRGRGAAR